MRIILTEQCESLTGSLGRGYGYFIQRRGAGFFSQSSKHQPIPPDGHWRFIVACAQLAYAKLHVTDIEVHWMELSDALYEARHFVANAHVRKNGRDAVKLTYNARDILNLKTTFGL